MRLASAVVGPLKSIDRPQTVTIDPHVTVLVGMNEAGKTVFLQGLSKCRDVLGLARFDPLDDYPRKDLPPYLRTHDTRPAMAARLVYELDDDEIDYIGRTFHLRLPARFQFSIEHFYDNSRVVELRVDERPALMALLAGAELSDEARSALSGASSLRDVRDALKRAKLTYADNEFLDALDVRVEETAWPSVVGWEIWQWLEPRVPGFLYFGEYELLPSKMNVKDLAARQEAGDPALLTPEHRGILALLRMADIDVADFARPGSYERLKASIEGVSITLTDQIMEFWKQNEDLEVQIDIATDSYDQPPFNDGPNLYLRIRNRRHRGVSTPFKQRSRGFIWFFSFLVWFDSVQAQLSQQTNQDVILLLDEPGLSLHALAQRDLLAYIESLGRKHQVVYTTHSPFMIDAGHLSQVRTVEDLTRQGTIIAGDPSAADPRTVFPLRAALAASVVDRLLPSERALLVETPADLLLLSGVSSLLGHDGLGTIPVVPMGGLAMASAFSALMNAGRKLAIVQSPATDSLARLARTLPSGTAWISPADFCDPPRLSADVEDLFEPGFYINCFTSVYGKQLGGWIVASASLPAGDRIVDRLERGLSERGIVLEGGFNRVAVAARVLADLAFVDAGAKARFAALFGAIRRAL